MDNNVSGSQGSLGVSIISWIAMILVIIGALNWGLIGFFDIDVISRIFGQIGGRVIFAIIGLAGIWGFSFFPLLTRISCRKGGG